MSRAVTSSHESIASPGVGVTRSGSLRPRPTALQSTTLTSLGGYPRAYSFDPCFCGQIVRKADDVVKQSGHSCQSSLHLDSRDDLVRRLTTSLLWREKPRMSLGRVDEQAVGRRMFGDAACIMRSEFASLMSA
jgi:hypothetical protein